MKKMIGLIAHVYRCQFGGPSYNQVCLVNVDGPFSPSEDVPAAKLIKGNLHNIAKVILEREEKNQVIFNGCFVATSDSRFSEAIEKIVGQRFHSAVALHTKE